MNKFLGKGRLCKDIEINFIPGTDNSCLKNTLAIRRNYKNSEGQYDSDFINVVAFGKTAEYIANYFDKGQEILIEGKLKTGSYENKEGNKVVTTDVVIESVEFCGSKNKNNSSDDVDYSQFEDGTQPW